MRIRRLDLSRYGKFTDETILLPAADYDFHLIVGPNEAGKSTLRNAVQDLLFGIETRSRYGFLHAYADMRLGAHIEQGAEALEFVRVKGNRNTLRTPEDAALPENALAPFLGAVDRGFFEQMFGLDHGRLIKGGEEILSAANDVGQILFQAAAGIGSLGEIRERLEREADQLWARRRSNTREYYQASDELEQAEAALKQATVRTRDWQAAQDRVATLRASIEASRADYLNLEQERARLERLRRIAPVLAMLEDQERRLAELGAIIPLPETAGQQLTQAEQQEALATERLRFHEERIALLSSALEPLQPDAALLARQSDIDRLAAARVKFIDIGQDLGQREEEVRRLWQDIQGAAREFGWPEEDEARLTARLPDRLVRAALDDHLRRHEALAQAVPALREQARAREGEWQEIETALQRLPARELPADLAAALAAARALGDWRERTSQLDTQVARLEREQDSAARELDPWRPEAGALGRLALPAPEEIAETVRQRSELAADLAQLGERLRECEDEARRLALQAEQYRMAHQPVTLAEVRDQREQRDQTWAALKSGALTLSAEAERYERQVATADALADRRHDKAREAAEWQSRLDRLETSRQQAECLARRRGDLDERLAAFDAGWVEQTAALGLSGLPLLRFESWRAARERALQLASALEEALAAAAGYRDVLARAMATLSAALPADAEEDPGQDLSGLIRRADTLLTRVTAEREQRRLLTERQPIAVRNLRDALERQAAAESGLDAWNAEFRRYLVQAGLSVELAPGAARGALELLADLRRKLDKLHEIRADRIDPMSQERMAYTHLAEALLSAVAPDLAGHPADQVALELDTRLRRATEDARERQRLLGEQATAAQALQEARQSLHEARGLLQPLLERLPAAASREELRQAITAADTQRRLVQEREQSIAKLLKEGDGLDRAALETESAAVDPLALPGRLAEIRQQLDERVEQQNRWSADLRLAEEHLARIAGQDDAARAESRRQEALARMAAAVERFVKVHTAARLLRWSIERFRETRQGPLLGRASEIFRGLTRGALQRLSVDYDHSPLVLRGQRPNGAWVGLDGMSEGTRDQLYMALRLAALELHLEQTPPLPFLADDLFINYDDTRSRAGFAALAELSRLTQVIFLSHHEHLADIARDVLGDELNVVRLG